MPKRAKKEQVKELEQPERSGVQRMRWVKASERKPQKKDGDIFGVVLVRRRPYSWNEAPEGSWLYGQRLVEIGVEDAAEWLEGANL